MELYSEIGRKALQFFHENMRMIKALSGTKTIIYYEQFEDEDGYQEFHFWNSSSDFDEASLKQHYSIYFELEKMENPTLYLLMDNFFDHVSIH